MGSFPSAVGVYTHRGRRRANEDAILTRRIAAGELVALADGMGGQAAGEVASARTLEVLVSALEAGQSLRAGVQAANAAVYAEAGQTPGRQGMGSTLVAVLRQGDAYSVVNVGDSRAYRIRGERIEQITTDHSFVAEALARGELSAEEASASPWRNALTRAVGTDPDTAVDVFGPFPIRSPEVLLLCSDGLYKAVPENLIREYVLGTENVRAAADALGALAFRRGSDDNISVAVLEFGAVQRAPRALTLPVSISRQTEIKQGMPRPAAAPRPAVAEPNRLQRSRKSRRILPKAVPLASLLVVVGLAAALGLAWLLFGR